MLSRRLLRIKVIKALYAHFKAEADSMIASEKNLVYSIDKTYDLYLLLLVLIVDVCRYAENRIELGKKKHLPSPEDLNPNTKFVDNRVIAQIAASRPLCDYLEQHALGWANDPESIKKLYDKMVASEYYRDYMANERRTYKDDLKLVEAFYLNEIDDNEELENVLEEQSIFWADDLDFALIMVMRTLQGARASQEEIVLLPKFKSDDDLAFARELFRKTLVNYKEYLGYIERFTQNWDVDRIAFMDNVIMATAMAELLAFPSIPVKVTLDEYIEIAKYYSTPGSSVFINGVLDKIVEALEKEERIQKTGRGLL